MVVSKSSDGYSETTSDRTENKDSAPKTARDNSSKRKSKTTRPAAEFNPLKDAIVLAFGWKLENMTTQSWGKVDKAAAELYDVGRRAEDVPALYRYCQRRYDTFGPNALAGAVPEVAKLQIVKTLAFETPPAEPADVTAEYYNFAGVVND
jgi:hypothetical protein